MTSIILFGYPSSPYYQKVISVLQFAQLPFSVCSQPALLPRPDFASVGITYRRIPALSIDGHLYCDTSLIIAKLCELAGVANHKECEFLGTSMFTSCAALIPAKLISDENFLRDRSELTGRPWTVAGIQQGRPNALSQFLAHLDVVTTVLENGGGYVRSGKVTTADLHIAFLLRWVLHGHHGADPEVSPQTHPAIYSWLERVQEACKGSAKPSKVSFQSIRAQLTSVPQVVGNHHHNEPLKLQIGQDVSVTPIDTGRKHPQVGQVQYLNSQEICLKVASSGVVISFPRIGFSISRVTQDSKM